MTDAEISIRVEEIVLGQIETDQLILPALPAVASRCLTLLGDEELDLREVSRLIESDPILAALLVRRANAAAFAPATPLASVIDCITRVGTTELRFFLMETSARQVFESRDRQITQLCRGLWEHSLAVAMLSRALLRHAGSSMTDEGYLAGLLHDIGKPVVAAMLLEAERRLRGTRTQNWLVPAAWINLISRVHRGVGVALAEKWGLPDVIFRSIRNCDDYDSADPRSVGNAVRFANAMAKRQGVSVGANDKDDIESLIFVGCALFQIDANLLSRMTSDLKGRVDQRMV